jgi:3'(2'), 5'-bisphosphate nucleotidase
MQLNAEKTAAIELADQAADIALEVYNREFLWEEKGDDRGPVTEADRKVNEFLVNQLKERFPDDTVVGEESKKSVNLNAERLWIIDPIDGTKDFLRKNGEWSIMIGLTIGGHAVLGLVYQPTEDKLYVGVDKQGTTLRHKGEWSEIHVNDSDDPEAGKLVRSRSHPDSRIDTFRDNLGIGGEYRHGSVGCKLAQISEQRADLYLNLSGKCHMWDTCGPEVVIREAGGDLLTFDGERIDYSGSETQVTAPFFATTAALKPKVLAELARLRGGWGI